MRYILDKHVDIALHDTENSDNMVACFPCFELILSCSDSAE